MLNLLKRIRANHENLVCFGAGRMLQNCCDMYADLDFFRNIFRIGDNYVNSFTWNGRNVSIYSPAHLLDGIEKPVVLITCMAYDEVFEQLNRLPEYRNVSCYISVYVHHIPYSYVLPPFDSAKLQLIPKKIHYVWFGGKEIPKRNRNWMKSWQKYCPDYEIVRWDESNYDVAKNKYMFEAYTSGKFAFASDYARVDILFNHGGVYFDNDVELLNGIDHLLQLDAFCAMSYAPNTSNTAETGLGNGAGFGAQKGNFILQEVLDLYKKHSFINKDGSYNLMNCDYYLGKVLLEHGLKPQNKLQTVGNMTILPTDVFSPMDNMCRCLAFSVNTCGIHHFDASWFSEFELSKRKRELSTILEFQKRQPIISD